MPSLLQVAKKYGAQVVTPNASLPRLAIEAAHAVASGHASARGDRWQKVAPTWGWGGRSGPLPGQGKRCHFDTTVMPRARNARGLERDRRIIKAAVCPVCHTLTTFG
jgi:hypothetical protein